MCVYVWMSGRIDVALGAWVRGLIWVMITAERNISVELITLCCAFRVGS